MQNVILQKYQRNTVIPFKIQRARVQSKATAQPRPPPLAHSVQGFVTLLEMYTLNNIYIIEVVVKGGWRYNVFFNVLYVD